jgi:hypothetical protein
MKSAPCCRRWASTSLTPAILATANAGRSKKQQLADADCKRSANQVELDRKIVGEEIDRKGVVVGNAADPGRRHNDHIGPITAQPVFRVGLPGQVERAAIGRDHLAMLAPEPPHQRAAHHAAMASDEKALSAQIERQCSCGKLACHGTAFSLERMLVSLNHQLESLSRVVMPPQLFTLPTLPMPDHGDGGLLGLRTRPPTTALANVNHAG